MKMFIKRRPIVQTINRNLIIERSIEKILCLIFPQKIDRLIYLPTNGIIPCKVNMYNEFIDNCAKIFFQIMESSKIEYFLFAGSAIGLIRDGKNIPWVDDYDIMIFEEYYEKLKNEIFPILKKNGFTIIEENGIIYILSQKFPGLHRSNYFQCDIFISRINNGYVKNIGGRGLYNKKNLKLDIVRPQNYQNFNGLKLPFFNKFIDDIKIEYIEVLNSCLIHIDHGFSKIRVPFNWQRVYNVWEKIIKNVKENTINFLNNNEIIILNNVENIINYNAIDVRHFDIKDIYVLNSLKILAFIVQKKVDFIDINDSLLEYCCNIKFFKNDIYIKIRLNNISINDYEKFSCCNYVDEIVTDNKEIYDALNDIEIVWLKKPVINLIE
jgi:phosphorylcholine metabolism protein LicD